MTFKLHVLFFLLIASVAVFFISSTRPVLAWETCYPPEDCCSNVCSNCGCDNNGDGSPDENGCDPCGGCCRSTGWTCFPAGTKISKEDGTTTNIEDIKPGDTVISESEDGVKSLSTVTKLDTPIRDQMCRITFTSGETLRLTDEHPLMTQSGWKSINPNKTAEENPQLIVEKLEPGDRIVRNDPTEAVVQNITCWSEQIQAYNLLLDSGAHTYFANGYLAHNKGGGSCTPSSPDTPVLSSPANGSSVSAPGDVSVTFSWLPIAQWGKSCQITTKMAYTLCVGPDSVNPCSGGTTIKNYGSVSLVNGQPKIVYPDTSAAVSVSPGTSYWKVRANNPGGRVSAWSDIWGACVEGFDQSNTSYVSNWSSCDANTHKRTRTCREDCGMDNCTALGFTSGIQTEDCLGQIRGTLFDASNIDVCPSFNPATGYSTGLPSGTGISLRSFGLTDQSATAPHPWSPLSPVTTDVNGNYSINVYAPSNYVYDFSALAGQFSIQNGPKLICTSSVATVPTNPTNCTTQPCSLINNMSFGFTRVFGGWWQAQGSSVHAEGGVQSRISASLTPSSSQVLILPDTSPTNRTGFLSYGTNIPNRFGGNSTAQVSQNLWEKLSSYQSSIYDWSYFHQRFSLFPVTAWVANDPITYDDAGNGYQIFQTNTSVTNFNFSPSAGQKAIFDINGDVTITGNITVPPGAFLGVIASGTITFNPSVTQADGWYVGGRISIPCTDTDGSPGCDQTDSTFQGNGSFIGWGSVDLTRDLGSGNNTSPAEKFSYRSDLYTNAPEPLKVYSRIYKPFIP